MASQSQSKSALFEVYLRLRPAAATAVPNAERFLSVEESDAAPTHITLNPPNDNRRRAVEKFAFTRVFEEDAGQLNVFQGTGVVPLVEGVLGEHGGEGRDGLLATLGVTGSGKSHTILGSRTQRGLTQLALDLLFRTLDQQILDPKTNPSLHATVAASDPSESQVMSAAMFLDTMFADASGPSRASSRAPTPMVVRSSSYYISQVPFHSSSQDLYPTLKVRDSSPKSIRIVDDAGSDASREVSKQQTSSYIPSYMQSTLAKAAKFITKSPFKGETYTHMPPPTPRRNAALQRPSMLPQSPDISNVTVRADPNAEYAILISMYEVYNDRIFDLLTPASVNKSTKEFRRRPLLYKHTEFSPDRKVVAGLRKIICGSVKEALMVLETGLHERRVAGTGSNSASSRSHGFFCVEVKKRRRSRMPGAWGGSTLTVVDLAGSERARDAKTQGATLAEAGKINESLMYLGQCLQMQSDLASSTKPNVVPFRQCKLTELLFSNSFPSASSTTTSYATPSHQSLSSHHPQRNPQKAIMIVTADPLGDFNATSQILRYSALAREITVPRIPSVTSQILAQSTASHYFSPRTPGRATPTDSERETMEIAALEIARMSEEIEGLRAELLAEQERRLEVEAHLESLTDRALEIEAEIREECHAEFEGRMVAEGRRWKARWAEEMERSDAHVDRKLDIYTRSMDAAPAVPAPFHIDVGAVVDEGEDKENRHSGPMLVKVGSDGNDEGGLEDENQKLRFESERLRREMKGMEGNSSPTKGRAQNQNKRMPLRESVQVGEVGREMERLKLGSNREGEEEEGREGKDGNRNGNGSPMKKVRKLTTRKWDLGDEGELL